MFQHTWDDLCNQLLNFLQYINNRTVLLLHVSWLWQYKSPVTNLRQNPINCVLLLTSAESHPSSLMKLNMKEWEEAACH